MSDVFGSAAAILPFIRLLILIIALRLTRDHFRKARAARFIERYNSPDMLAIRIAVDEWLESSNDDQARLRELHKSAELSIKVRAFANLFVELGAAYRERSVDRKYVGRVFDYLLPHYWKSLRFWIIDYRRRASKSLYGDFEYLARHFPPKTPLQPNNSP